MSIEIKFFYETTFEAIDETDLARWLTNCVLLNKYKIGELNFVFCNDEYLLELNQKYLEHNTFTDIITFDYSEVKLLSGDVFISIERVRENAVTFKVDFFEELRRVIAHGVLHLMGYGDKNEVEKKEMRRKEDEFLKLFHVEH